MFEISMPSTEAYRQSFIALIEVSQRLVEASDHLAACAFLTEALQPFESGEHPCFSSLAPSTVFECELTNELRDKLYDAEAILSLYGYGFGFDKLLDSVRNLRNSYAELICQRDQAADAFRAAVYEACGPELEKWVWEFCPDSGAKENLSELITLISDLEVGRKPGMRRELDARSADYLRRLKSERVPPSLLGLETGFTACYGRIITDCFVIGCYGDCDDDCDDDFE